MKLYAIKYGNGWGGSRDNLGEIFVLAESVKAAKELLAEKKNIKISHMSAAKEISVIKA